MKKIIEKYYLTSVSNIASVMFDTGLSEYEIEEIVGRFKLDHRRKDFAGKLKGQVYLYKDKVQLRHHFTKKILYESYY